jgi:Glycosyltransferase family 87
MLENRFRSKSYYLKVLWIIIGFAITFFVFEFTIIGISESFSKPVIFFISCVLVHYSAFKQKKYEIPISNIVLGIMLFLITSFFYDLAQTYLIIPKWDFYGFYLFGKVGIMGLNFYDPHAFMQVFNNLDLQSKVGGGFTHEIVNVGFWYPPPSMFLFLPLGLFSLKTGYIIWQSVIISFLVIDILLVIKWYPYELTNISNKSITGFLLAILILLFPSITGSIVISQTASIFLFFLILLLKYRDNWKSGVCLILLIIIKPLAAIFVLYFIIFKKWKVLISFFLSGCLILGVSILFFGYDSFLIFLKSPPTARIPMEVYYESSEESIHAVLLRLQLRFYGHINFQIIKIVTYALSIPLILITFYSSKVMSKKNPLLSFMIFIPMALLIYPNTLDSYAIILIPVILYFLEQDPFKNNFVNWIFIFLLYSIGHYSFFLLNLFLWAILVILSLPDKYNFLIMPWLGKLNLLSFQSKNHVTTKTNVSIEP